MKIFAHYVIIGKDVTFRCIESLKKQIPKEHTLKILAHVYRNPRISNRYIHNLSKIVDELTITTVNYCNHAQTLPMLFFPFDWFIEPGDDCFFLPGAVKKVFDIIGKDPMAGCIGGFSQTPPISFYPDIGLWYSKRAINECGALKPSYPGYGYAEMELLSRFRFSGFNIYAVKEYILHSEEAHTGRDAISNFKKLIAKNQELFDIDSHKGFPVKEWWKVNLDDFLL